MSQPLAIDRLLSLGLAEAELDRHDAALSAQLERELYGAEPADDERAVDEWRVWCAVRDRRIGPPRQEPEA